MDGGVLAGVCGKYEGLIASPAILPQRFGSHTSLLAAVRSFNFPGVIFAFILRHLAPPPPGESIQAATSTLGDWAATVFLAGVSQSRLLMSRPP
ncbi:hypothetical protein E2C01_040740 [Portunus trituberculatus]|uniref:Uncharacterized protein n=1 Tax=Portunus trituberculatus TaxID=210409 RepID=A0A5B7FN98_PORTR|nr:hypothetical protein [Portunus trituberculatus]